MGLIPKPAKKDLKIQAISLIGSICYEILSRQRRVRRSLRYTMYSHAPNYVVQSQLSLQFLSICVCNQVQPGYKQILQTNLTIFDSVFY